MDIDKILKSVSTLNEYIVVTQDINKKLNNSKIQFNMSTVLSLKKVRALEIEYFNKCEGCGAAIIIFQRMVELPPSKTWILLGKELVAMLQYWLDAMRKHLIKHSVNWWNFTKLLLGFIKSIRLKDKTLPDILVEGTGECLLDLATRKEPDVTQRLEILYCLNLCCAESSREIRFASKNKLEDYFTKLSRLMSSCGHLPSQYSMLETLLRWLLPRHDSAVRSAAAAKWFPEGGNTARIFLDRPWQDFLQELYPISMLFRLLSYACLPVTRPATKWFPKRGNTVRIFLDKPGQNLLQDARDLLNAYNEASDLVVSVLIRKLTIGTVVVISGVGKRETWLDVNSSDRSVSILLDAKVLDTLGLAPVSWETLLLHYEDIVDIQLTRESKGVTLSVHTHQLARVFSSGVEIGDSCELKAVVATSYIERLDRALLKVFGNKYKVLFDVGQLSLSPPQQNPEKKHVSQDEDTRFSHPVEVQRRKHSGYIVRSRNPIPWRSPSTASTSSLAQLHEKLASIPQYKFEKEAVHVCALPELSTVTEVSEFDDRQSLISNSTLKLNRPYGVCHKSLINTNRNSQSDGEVHKRPKVGRYISPVAKDDEHSTSCLLVATVGSTDESVINDTLERLHKTKDFPGDSIVDLLVQEALQRDFHDKDGLLDSGINTGDKKTQDPNETNSEAIENTPNVDKYTKQNNQSHEKTCTVISNTTTDESNDVVDDTPFNFVSVRRRKQQLKEKKIAIEEERLEFDVQAVDNFFSQHITENKRGEIVVSPSLARKINETSSESENFDECLMREHDNMHFKEKDQPEIQEISDWLDRTVEKVCRDLEKCTEIIRNDDCQKNIIDTEKNVSEFVKSDDIIYDVSNTENTRANQTETDTVTKNTIKNKAIKLKYNTKKVTKSRAKGKNNKNKLELETTSNMTPITEVKETKEEESDRPFTPQPTKDSPTNKFDINGTPLLRKKRKLYSPKDENVDEERKNAQIIETEEDTEFKTSRFQTPKSTATCYKEIEKERKKHIRQPRKRRSKTKSESPPSPRTKKINDIFDHLKDKVESNESITTVTVSKKSFDKDLAIFNFTSDSEDEDFKKKKLEIQKRTSSTTIASGDASMSARHRRAVNRVNYLENKSSDESNKKNPKKIVRRKRQAKTRLVKPKNDLVDERMRNADPVDLNTSLVVEKSYTNALQDPVPVIAEIHQMEIIPDESVLKIIELDEPKKRQRSKKTDALSLKKDKANNINTLEIGIATDDRTESPLPGLVVETIPTNVDDVNDSVSANMLQKFKKYYQEGPETYINESNTTQNLLTDLDKITCSPPPINITDELNKIEAYDAEVNDFIYNNTSRVTRSKKKDSVVELVDEGKKGNRTTIVRVKKEISSNIKWKHVENVVEVVNISEISDINSEKSIATVGKSPITAHGDNDEAPPNSEMLSQKLKPRNLEIEDLDQSFKDYYNKLNKEVTNAANKCTSGESGDTRLIKNGSRASSKEKSIVVSVSRLSIDDISKWLPSRRNSDTDSSCSDEIANPNSQFQKDNRASKSVDTEQSSNKSKHVTNKTRPTVLNLEDIILELEDNQNENTRTRKSKRFVLQYPQNTGGKIKNTQNTCESPVEIVEIKNQKKKSRTKVKKTKESSSEDLQQLENTKRLRSHKRVEDQTVGVDRNNTLQPLTFNIENTPKSKDNNTRKSLISPIKLFEEMFPTAGMVRTNSSSDEESVISHIQYKQSNTKVQKENKSKKKMHQENIETSPENISASTRIVEPSKSRKRKLYSSVKEKVKRVRISPEVELLEKTIDKPAVTISDSGPSESSVNEWFRRNAPISRAESINASFKESIQSVMEKLDTTLAEIHQNTSKKFVHMFVDAQKHLTDLKQERRKMFRSVASDILSEVVKMVDAKFAELDQKSQEMDVEFMNQLKVQASELIRDDCKKKHVMITLLREDIQAVMDHMENQRRPESP